MHRGFSFVDDAEKFFLQMRTTAARQCAFDDRHLREDSRTPQARQPSGKIQCVRKPRSSAVTCSQATQNGILFPT